MPYKTWGTEVLTSADIYLMRQALIVCTSGTRPPPVTGMHIWQTDTNSELVWDGSAWRTIRWADNVNNPISVNARALPRPGGPGEHHRPRPLLRRFEGGAILIAEACSP
ncbi:hypothetical protein [Microbispora siamensis]|uniref:Pyridoxamine 5'-phosphate oxidase putative domain-containing protein n=1 Tax=Microbispora siamensis TaxID=564413 RepID=A0ABQ4GCP3_9ACTN|nr:hypothetical protein [Microbispora siamensis]GIH59192.1 hypothetical protein Msi02_00090 [Microbispora siamensis]